MYPLILLGPLWFLILPLMGCSSIYWANLPEPRSNVPAYRISGDDKLPVRVALIAHKLASAHPLPVDRVLVISSDSLNASLKAQGKKGGASPINAGAYRCGEGNPPPSGCIYFGNDLLNSLTDDAIAGILAHELGHLERGHRPSPDLQAALGVQQAGQDVCTRQANTRDEAIGSLVGCGISLIGFGAAAVAAGYSRDVEREADASAIVRLSAAGYCAGPLMQNAFAELSRLLDSRGAPQSDVLLDTHPSLRERWQNAGSACGPAN